MELKSSNQEKSTKDGKTSYTIREQYDNDESKTCRVDEVENGFIISIEHSYYEDPKGDGCRQWKCEEKRFISKTNPLAEMKQNEKKESIDKTDTKAIAKSISSFISGISNNLYI